MTAYGRSSGPFSVEIASVNRKGLDISVSLPPALLFLEPTLRKWVADIAARGQVSVRIGFDMKAPEQLLLLLQEEKKRWTQIAKSLGFSSEEVSFDFLVEQAATKSVPLDEKRALAQLKSVWDKAASAWTKMKEKEGAALVRDILKRVALLQSEMKQIAKLAPAVKTKCYERLKARMKELNLAVDEEKIIKEAAFSADRADVTEELTRLSSHIDQMKEYLISKESSVGRTLDFLAQEMGREVSTLTAKAGDADIAKRAVKMKAEVEKIREQVQNIE
jgi:uncharacterized protein (TIGR00255 family)